MTGLLVKCLMLTLVLHGLRVLGRRIGPRASGLILGLPSSTAILLVLCGWEKGRAGATEMAEASLLGLVAAVALPLAYAQAIHLGWGLAGALPAAVAVYVAVATGLGCVPPQGAGGCLTVSAGAILLASYLAGRIGVPLGGLRRAKRPERWAALVRTAIPAAYVLLAGIVGSAASPSCAGLLSTFPSMSVAVLLVTHLEEGPATASRLARTLPPANLSTVVFLAAFRFGCPGLGLAWGTSWAYLAALASLAAVEFITRRPVAGRFIRDRRPGSEGTDHGAGRRAGRAGIRIDLQAAPRHFAGPRPVRRRHFAPLVEALPC
jgi:hypothetical protein